VLRVRGSVGAVSVSPSPAALVSHAPDCGASVDAPPRLAAGAERRLVLGGERLLRSRRAAELDVGLLCGATGVSPAAFRGVFADRGELLARVFDRVSACACRRMLAAYGAQGCWVDSVRAALCELLSFVDAEPGLARFLIVDSLTGDAAMLARRADVLARLACALESGSPSVSDPGGCAPASFGAAAVVGAAASLLAGRLVQEPARPVRELGCSLMGMLVLPYLGVGGTRQELLRTG